MAYTHTYEIKFGEVDIEGEIIFNTGEDPKVLYETENLEMTIKNNKLLHSFFECLVSLTKNCGVIEKIEINQIA